MTGAEMKRALGIHSMHPERKPVEPASAQKPQLSVVPPPKADDAPTPSIARPPGTVTTPSTGKWAKYAGKLGAAAGVGLSAKLVRAGGHEPNDPDDADVDLLQEALAEGLQIKFGVNDVPWWFGAFLAGLGVYAGMRMGAAPLEKGERRVDDDGSVIPDAVHESQAGEEPVPSESGHHNFSGLFANPVKKTN